MRRYFEDGAVYFVTAVTRDRRPLFNDRRLCRILLVTFEYYRMIFDYSVFGYCVMPDHIHLILRPSHKFNISMIMKMVKGSFTRKVNKLRTQDGSMWQPRYYDEIIRSEKQLLTQLDYMHQNPVAAGLVPSADKYLYSSFSQYENVLNPEGLILEIERSLGDSPRCRLRSAD